MYMQKGKYGAERNLVCTTCGRENLGRTDLHHIIDQAFIKKRAKRWQLEYLANGILSKEYMEDMEDSDIINVLVNKNNRNITEMCQICHKMTNSYQQYLDSRKKVAKKKKSKERKRTNRKFHRGQCQGINTKGEQCKKRNGVFTNGFCHHHIEQKSSKSELV